MQFSTVFPLEGRACMSPVRRSSDGSGSDRLRIGDSSSLKHEGALRRMCFGARGTAKSAQCVLTSDAGPDTLVSSIPTNNQVALHHCLFFSVLGSTNRWLSNSGCENLQVVRTSFRRNYADPNEVAAVILGGGTGTQLFPLTSTRATPAVR